MPLKKIILVAGCGLLMAQRVWYFSSSQGDDGNDGRTPQTPLRSVEMLQRLVSGQAVAGQRLSRGDTIAFLRGDTFRVVRLEGGTLRGSIAFSGSIWRQPGAPVVITAYGGDLSAPLPLFTGTWRLSDSARAIISEGNIVKIAKPFGNQDSLVVLRVFYRGQPLRPARFPDDTAFVIEENRAHSQQDPDTLICSALQSVSPVAIRGALLWISIGSDYTWECSRAVDLSGSFVMYLPSSRPEGARRGARFFFEGKREFISTPGEWAYDEQDDTLYLYPPQLPFNPADYELMVIGTSRSGSVIDSKAFTFTAAYDIMPPDPIQGVHIENLHFMGLVEAVRTAGVFDFTIRHCLFTHSYRPLWNFLSHRLFIQENQFYDNEDACIVIAGRTPSAFLGDPRTLTRHVYVERNLIKRTGLQPRWSWEQLRVDSIRFVREDYSIVVRSNTDSVFIRYNRIDSVSQGGIGGYCYYYTESTWNNNYPGTIPFIVEKNYISNFCMDFADCGGIKFISFMKNGIIRDNILVKGVDRDKSHLSSIYRIRAKGIYTDVRPHDVSIEGNTVIGTDAGCGNSHGGGRIRNIKVQNNIFYGCVRYGVGCGSHFSEDVDGVEVTGNLFFLGMQAKGAVTFGDNNQNGRRDTYDVVSRNWYGHPTFSASYVYEGEDGSRNWYGFRAMRTKTAYERSILSKWIRWVGFKEWEGAAVQQSLLSNPELNPGQELPIRTFGRARIERVGNSPFGGDSAYLVWYPDTAPPGIPSGVGVARTQPLYNTVMSSGDIYRWTLIWASNKATDYSASTSHFRYTHPNTGDTLAHQDIFALPVYMPFQPETLRIRYEPRLNNQFWVQPRIFIERGDSIWLRYWSFEKIQAASVPTLAEVYPIFINPSDTVARFSLPAGWLYLTLDSMLVWGSVEVQPWKSRILVRLRYDPSIAGLEGRQVQRTQAIAYPNPCRDYIRLVVPEAARIFLYDLQGQLLYTGEVNTEQVLPVELLSKGMYILRVSYLGGYEETIKLIRE